MRALKSLPHYTFDDYLSWEGKWELIDGIPYAMSPAASTLHQLIANNLGIAFGVSLNNCKACKGYQPIDYKVSEDTVVQPDLLIVNKPIQKTFLDFTPALVIEILSPSTKDKDRHSKYSIFERQGIPWYLIVDPVKEVVEIYQLIDNEYTLAKTVHDERFVFNIDPGCQAKVLFKEVW